MPNRLALAPALALLGFLGLPAAAAQEPTFADAATDHTDMQARADQVVALLNGTAAPEDIFTDGFRAAIADAQIKALSTNLTAQLGRAVEAILIPPRDSTRAALEIRFERGIAKGSIAIDLAQGNRINELRFTSVDSLAVAGDTAEKIVADLAALPGSVNAWFGPLDGEPVIGLDTGKPLALGSTFKLYVLAALAEDVKAKRRKWSDVVPLTEKSYPSGKLQDWPQGAPVTLHTLASLMISISDNTATDELIMVLGRERILELMRDSGHANPAANDPFLTTRELFMLKADPALTSQWRNGNEAAQAGVIGTLAARTDPPLDEINAAFGNGPKAIDIEWFASPVDVVRLFAHMQRTADPKAFEIMAISPSVNGEAITARWDYIGYKGGSEPGVLNYTWLLRDTAGRDWVLTLGWNNPASVVDEGMLNAIAQRILLLPR